MTFGSLGYGPQARSVLHCHGVLALRGGPWPRAVQDVKVGRQSQGLELEKARFEAGFYAIQKVTFGSLGYGPQARSVLHCHVFWPCEGVLGPELCRMKAGRQSQGLELEKARFEANF